MGCGLSTELPKRRRRSSTYAQGGSQRSSVVDSDSVTTVPRRKSSVASPVEAKKAFQEYSAALRRTKPSVEEAEAAEETGERCNKLSDHRPPRIDTQVISPPPPPPPPAAVPRYNPEDAALASPPTTWTESSEQSHAMILSFSPTNNNYDPVEERKAYVRLHRGKCNVSSPLHAAAAQSRQSRQASILSPASPEHGSPTPNSNSLNSTYNCVALELPCIARTGDQVVQGEGEGDSCTPDLSCLTPVDFRLPPAVASSPPHRHSLQEDAVGSPPELRLLSEEGMEGSGTKTAQTTLLESAGTRFAVPSHLNLDGAGSEGYPLSLEPTPSASPKLTTLLSRSSAPQLSGSHYSTSSGEFCSSPSRRSSSVVTITTASVSAVAPTHSAALARPRLEESFGEFLATYSSEATLPHSPTHDQTQLQERTSQDDLASMHLPNMVEDYS